MSKVQEELEQEGKEQIGKALASIDMSIEDIDNLDCDEDEPIQEGEEVRDYPDDPLDTVKGNFLDKHMKGY